MNVVSLPKHSDELHELIQNLEYPFSVIGLSETRIQQDSPLISLDEYTTFSTPSESLAGGTALLISKNFICKPREDLSDLCYSPKLLESTFVEITKKKKQV